MIKILIAKLAGTTRNSVVAILDRPATWPQLPTRRLSSGSRTIEESVDLLLIATFSKRRRNAMDMPSLREQSRSNLIYRPGRFTCVRRPPSSVHISGRRIGILQANLLTAQHSTPWVQTGLRPTRCKLMPLRRRTKRAAIKINFPGALESGVRGMPLKDSCRVGHRRVNE